MSETVTISFDKLKAPVTGTAVFFAGPDVMLGAIGVDVDKRTRNAIARASKSFGFKGKKGSFLEILVPEASELSRILVIGTGPIADVTLTDWLKLGGALAGKFGPTDSGPFCLVGETSAGALNADAAAELMLGLKLGAYRFDRYKTKNEIDGEPMPVEAAAKTKVTILVSDVPAARKAAIARQAVAEGVLLARDLVNLPANDLGPLEFVKFCQELSALGVKVEVLTEKEMSKLGMLALLGVGQGSRRGSRLVVMRWDGAKAATKPLAFVGKGVVFDTGGISIKPAQSMEDMKGDMAGAACVTGLMRTLARRKAKVNAIGIIGLVENMPDGNAQRPGDVVRSMSGQTIEIINTDAEGRLVLADALWYCQQRFKPQFMVNLATLTGAILVALGQEHAGLFSNNDDLSEQLLAAGLTTDEKLWRLPLSRAYDKIIDSKIADVKNSAGRNAGAITAAQFLQRFVNGTPWAHLDIAGTGMAVSPSDINRSWGPGFGVRLLNQMIADNFEKGKA